MLGVFNQPSCIRATTPAAPCNGRPVQAASGARPTPLMCKAMATKLGDRTSRSRWPKTGSAASWPRRRSRPTSSKGGSPSGPWSTPRRVFPASWSCRRPHRRRPEARRAAGLGRVIQPRLLRAALLSRGLSPPSIQRRNRGQAQQRKQSGAYFCGQMARLVLW
jgi:hypothetical protein